MRTTSSLQQIRRLTALALLSLCLIPFGEAQATYISDNYVGSNDHGYGDRIGDSLYEIQGADISFDAAYMYVKVYTNFTPDSYGTIYGDLFISTNGWHPYGSAPYTSDNANNGEGWEFVFDTSQNQLYGDSFSIMLSTNAPPKSSTRPATSSVTVRRSCGTAAETPFRAAA